MGNFFQDTIDKFKLLPEVGKQLWKTAESQATAKKVATRLSEVQTPTTQPIQLKPGNFFGDIAKKFNLTKPQEFKFQPTKQTKREITPEEREKADRMKSALVEFARAFPREGAGAVLEIQSKLSGKEIIITPSTRAEKFLFGERPVESLSNQGEDFLKAFGVNPDNARIAGLPIGVAMLALDLVPGGNKAVTSLLVKANKIDDVKKILVSLKGIDKAKITDDLVRTIAKSSDGKQIAKLVEGLKVTEAAKLEPLTSISKAKASGQSFDEWVKGQTKTSQEFGFAVEKYIEVDLPIKDIHGRMVNYMEYRDIAQRGGLPSAGRQVKMPIKITAENIGDLKNTRVDIIDGNQRLRQAIANGDETIPAKVFIKPSQLKAEWDGVSKGKELVPGAEAKITKQTAEGLAPKAQPTSTQPTTLPQTKEVLPLKETGEPYTAKELSSDALYQKTGVPSTIAKQADTIAKDLPKNPTKWNRFTNLVRKSTTSFKEKVVNDWQRVKELSETKGLKLTGDLTPYERRKLMAGRQTARLQETEEIVRKIDKDILTTSKKLKVKDTELQSEVFDYLKARHAPERNLALGEKAAGITTKEAEDLMTKLKSSPHFKEVERIANDLQKFHNKTLDILYAEGKPWGVIDKDLYDVLKTKYKNHIPLNRVMDTDDIGEVLSGRGLAVKGTGLKRAVGSEREVKDVLENIYTARTQAIQRVEKNIVDNGTYQFVEDYIKSFPEQELFEVVKPKAIGKTFEGKILTKQINDPTVLQLQRNGKPAFIKINDTRLAVAFRGVNREQLPGLMRYISTVTRWMSALVTRYSPEFVLSNKIRDLQEAVVYTSSQQGFKSGVKSIARDPSSLNDVKNFIIGKETEGTKLYKQMIEDGGTTGGLALSTRKQIEITLDSIRKTARSNPRKAFKTLVDSRSEERRVG